MESYDVRDDLPAWFMTVYKSAPSTSWTSTEDCGRVLIAGLMIYNLICWRLVTARKTVATVVLKAGREH